MKETFENLKKKYLELKSKNLLEINVIQEKLILEIFIKEMGYAENVRDEICLGGSCGYKIYIDSKASFYINILNDRKINDNNIKNFIDIIHRRSGVMGTYGMLTNGREYILVYSGLSIPSKEQVGYILKLDILKNSYKDRQRYFEYYSKEAIFQNRVTECFKMISQFRIYYEKQGKKYATYISTLERFFYFYAPPTSKNHMDYKKVDNTDILNFLENKQKADDSNSGRKISKKTALNNTFSHINSFYKCLLEHKEISEIKFDTNRKAVLRKFDATPILRDVIKLDKNDLNRMLIEIKKTRQSSRNTAIYTLCAYLGYERNEICSLKWEDVHEYAEIPYIENGNRQIPLCKELVNCFSNLREENSEKEKKGDKIPQVFTSYFRGKYKRIAPTSVNDIFEKLKNIGLGNSEKWNRICPQLLRYNLIPQMYKKGFSIEEIIYVTGIDIENIGKYITNEDIMSRLSTNQKDENLKNLSDRLSKHPFSEIFG